MDESLPAGNGVAARALQALGHLLGEPRYLDAAERTLRAAWPTLSEYPHACCTLLLALDDHLHPRPHVVIRADAGDAAGRWHAAARAIAPDAADIYFVPAGESGLPGVLAAPMGGRGGSAQVCHGLACHLPLTDPAALADALSRPMRP